MAEITVEGVNAKLAKKETLTPEETKFVMSMPPDGTEPKPEEDIDWGKAEDEDSEAETPEAKKAKEDAATAKKAAGERAKAAGLAETATEEEVVAAEKKKTEAAEDPKINTDNVERELAKPVGQENLKDFTPREKAYFHQMRRDRSARQKAEEERDAALFTIAKDKKSTEGKEKETPAEEDPLAELKGKDPTDFLTVAEVTKILGKVMAKPTAKKEEAPAGPDPVRMRYLQMCDQEARSAHPEDYDAVLELAPEIVNRNQDYLKAIAKAISQGENPAETTYTLIKEDPEFSKLFPVAQTKVKARKAATEKKPVKSQEDLEKERKAKAAEEALEKNKDKTKTTGHAEAEGGAGTETDKIDGYSINDIFKMSDLQFAKLPKKTREAFLQKYG